MYRPWGFYETPDPGRALPGEAHRGLARPQAVAAEALPSRRALGGGERQRSRDARQRDDAGARERERLPAARLRPPAGEPGQDPARADRGAVRRLSRRGRHRPARRRLQPHARPTDTPPAILREPPAPSTRICASAGRCRPWKITTIATAITAMRRASRPWRRPAGEQQQRQGARQAHAPRRSPPPASECAPSTRRETPMTIAASAASGSTVARRRNSSAARPPATTVAAATWPLGRADIGGARGSPSRR